MSRDIYLLQFEGSFVPKARPRAGRLKGSGQIRCYLPKNYRISKAAVEAELRRQADQIKMPVPDYQIRFYVSLFGRHSRAGDVVDNIPGTLYDAATKAEIIRGDSSKLAPGSTHDLHWSKDPPITYLAIAPWLPATKTPAQAIEVNNAIFDQAPDWVRALMTGDYPEKKTRRRKKSQ